MGKKRIAAVEMINHKTKLEEHVVCVASKKTTASSGEGMFSCIRQRK